MTKHRLEDMSWMEAQEAFRRCDTVIMPVGTLHGHGPTPLGIDAISAERLADDVAKRTGVIALPILPYGENDKMGDYPGSITISQSVLEGVYTDVCRSLHANGVRKVVFINGHGGNREPLIRAARNVRPLGMLAAILDWWTIGRKLMPDLWPEKRGSYMAELAVAIAIKGTAVADVRDGQRYKGEWGSDRQHRKLFGGAILPLGFNEFEYGGGPVTIPVDGWDIDVESEPPIDRSMLEALQRRGEDTIRRMVDHMAGFVRAFEKVNVADAFAGVPARR